MNVLHSETIQGTRSVERLVTGVPTSDGAGVKLTRVLTQPLQQRLDPFLMLDAFGTDRPEDYLAGFPDHPHRGFETVTYMIAGRMRHHDSAGNEGLLDNGGVQWMTAGRGVIHSELPEQENGRMEGFQLWLNLPAKDKMTAPWYRDLPNEALPKFSTDAGARVTVIAGRSHGVVGAVERESTAPLYLDVALPEGARFAQALPPEHNAFVYVYRGAVSIGGTTVRARQMAILKNEADGVEVEALGKDGQAAADRAVGADDTRLLLIAGRPLNEPIAQYGPFVMNTREELMQAVEDFQAGRFA